MGARIFSALVVEYELRGPVAVVTLDRPEVRNAVDPATAAELADAFRRFDSEAAASVAVLTGAGGTFCAGFDLRAVSQGAMPPPPIGSDGPMGPTRMRLSKPVIAAIEGFAVAGGLELALWCDLRLAAENAVLGILNRRFGVPLIDMGTIRLPRLIGQSRALDLVLTGRQVSADEALELGLVNRVVPQGQALTAAVAMAEELSQFPQTALRHDRLSVLEQWSLSEQDAIANELEHGMHSLSSGEAAQGATAFVRGKGRGGTFK
jgi:enoyl-CoA hydratase